MVSTKFYGNIYIILVNNYYMRIFRYIFLGCVAVALFAMGWYVLYHTSLTPATLGNNPLHLYVADTIVTRTKGLGGYSLLPEDYGMLFVFDHEDRYPFWMKDMQFPIDIIWIDKNYKVVEISSHIQPDSYPSTILPRTSAQYVVEVEAYWATRHSLRVGDILKY